MPQVLEGINTFTASDPDTAAAIAGDTSPIIPFAKMIPIGPKIKSARAALYITAFSPVAPCDAPAFNIALVAKTFVPTQSSSLPSGRRGRKSRTNCAPMPPP